MSLLEPVTWGEPMPRTPTTRRGRPVSRAAIAALTGLLVVSGMACGDDDDDGETGTDATAAETTTTTTTADPLTPEEEAKAVYLEFVEVVDNLVTESPDPDSPDLARLAVDPVYGTVRDSVATLSAENQRWRQGSRTSHSSTPAVIQSDGSAQLRDCLVEDDVLVDQDDGSIVRTQPLATRTLEVTLQPQADSWVVASIDVLAVVDGEVPCDQ
jgi:hypothetical protein